MKSNRLLQVLRNRSFLFLLLAEIFAQLAINMVNFALLVVVFDVAKSNTAVAGIVLSFTIPAIVFGLLAGVYVDHWNKKTVLLLTNIFRAILLVLLAIFRQDLVIIYVLTIAISVITQFFLPAETPMIPLLVKKDLLLQANALFGTIIYASILVAYALLGPFIIFFGHSSIFLVLAALFLLAALFVTFIKKPHAGVRSQEDKGYTTFAIADEIRAAFAIITKTKEVYHSLILLTASQVLVLVIAVVGPGFADQVLHIQAEAFPLYFISPAAMGMVVAALTIGYYFHSSSKRIMVHSGIFISGIGLLLLPYSLVLAKMVANPSFTSIHVMMIIAFFLGIANALVFVPSNTLVQEQTSNALRGKVYGILNSLIGIFSLFPVVIAGGMADIIGVDKVLLGIGGTILLIGISRVIFR